MRGFSLFLDSYICSAWLLQPLLFPAAKLLLHLRRKARLVDQKRIVPEVPPVRIQQILFERIAVGRSLNLFAECVEALVDREVHRLRGIPVQRVHGARIRLRGGFGEGKKRGPRKGTESNR